MSEKITSAHLNGNRKNDSHDLLHDIIIYLNKFPEKRINDLIENKQLAYFTARMMILQYHSSTSPFYTKYKKHRFYTELMSQYKGDFKKEDSKKVIADKIQFEERLKFIDDTLKELDWFGVEAFKIYYRDKHSYATLAKATQISKNTLYKAIRKVHEYIKEKVNE